MDFIPLVRNFYGTRNQSGSFSLRRVVFAACVVFFSFYHISTGQILHRLCTLSWTIAEGVQQPHYLCTLSRQSAKGLQQPRILIICVPSPDQVKKVCSSLLLPGQNKEERQQPPPVNPSAAACSYLAKIKKSRSSLPLLILLQQPALTWPK
jgi:hypothetical protein